KLRARYRYILVDEFQDTNHAQFELIRLLAAGEPANITVVGDDDQAIYRWRGAAAANLLAFRAAYPGAREVVLTENYRSRQQILDTAARLISYNNPYRLEVIAGIDKRLRSARGAGEEVRHLSFDTVSAESDAVAAMIAERHAQGLALGEMAILVRSNDDAEPFLRALNMRALPHHFSGSGGLYAREEVRWLIAFLRALVNPADSVSVFYLAASEVYGFPMADLLRMNAYARRKTAPLLEVLRGLPTNADLIGVAGQARAAAARLLRDIDRAAADAARMRTGELLYKYIESSGVLARLSIEASAEAFAQVKNLARFFEIVRAYGDVAEHDRAPSFVEHLDMMREAGDDPAVAEAEPGEEAVSVLTVHKAKGLEFAVVFLVCCAADRFPVRRRRAALALPAALLKDTMEGGDAYLREERRLFYVGMTRAKDELILTAARDYGTARPRKVSNFVVEALDLPSPSPQARRTAPLEALARHQPAAARAAAAESPISSDAILRLSFAQIDDYQTCPRKYHYVHILRVPLLAHHRVVYGSAIHKAVQELYRARLQQRPLSEDELVAAFRRAWVSEGFLSREHEEQRLRAGEGVLRRFYRDEARCPLQPTAVEQEFAFFVGRTKIIGRYDLVVEQAGRLTILDFKTGPVDDPRKAQERALNSLQLDIYALAYLKTHERLPDSVELHFMESGLVGAKPPALAETERTERVVDEVAGAIRGRRYTARPTYMGCLQCPFREICPDALSPRAAS
ncbi:MAG: ATP-dependent helicase, partial [Vicinamibacteria bacterium]|nr:ATP-dependent helicase [Vicinamibacteria bacterium]